MDWIGETVDSIKSLQIRQVLTQAVSLVESRSVQNSRTSSTSMSKLRMGIGATYHKQVQGMECNFKWNELEKMSRIYADWIEDIPLVHGSSSKAEC
ncbi:hypothetical protein GBA52_009917 [Prunus armeniaca]|nr:hypothetical protein GBA52_009917 [Prunus armeniaca]